MTEVCNESPAEEADLLIDDVIEKVNGKTPGVGEDLFRLSEGAPGKAHALVVRQPSGARRSVVLVKRKDACLAEFAIYDHYNLPVDAVTVQLSPQEERPEVTLVGEGPGLLTGKVFLNGRPHPGAKVSLFLGSHPRAILRRSSFPAVTDKDGRYVVRAPSGEAAVQGFFVNEEGPLSGKVLLTEAEDWAGLNHDLIAGVPSALPDIRIASPLRLGGPKQRELTSARRLHFKWARVPGAAQYRFELWPEDPNYGAGARNRLAETVEDPEYCCYLVPTERVRRKHTYYYWRVTAYSRSGRKIAMSHYDDARFVYKK